MNYGYAPTTNDATLAADLNELLATLAGKYSDWPIDRSAPYVEVNGLYAGVRIRKITNLTKTQEAELIERADAIYKRHAGR